MMNLVRVLFAAAGLLLVVLAIRPQWRRRYVLPYARGLALLIASCAVLAPFAWLVAAAFKDSSALNEYVFFPPLDKWNTGTINLSNFRELFAPRMTVHGTVSFGTFVLNSVFLATVTTTVQLVFCSLGGYALAKLPFPGKRLVMLAMLGTMMVPGMLLVAPLYELFVHAGLIDTYWALTLPSAVGAYGVLLFRQAILSIPDDILAAARIDGCSELGIYARIVMPLVRPTSAAFCLMTFLGSWNSYVGPSVLLQSGDKLTLPIVLSHFVASIEYQEKYGVFLAGTLIAIVPPAILFLLLQREFIRGLTSGAVKQ